MKNLIVQYYIDVQKYPNPKFNNLGPSPVEKYSSHSFQKYCKKYNIEYLKITQPKINYKHPTWERFDLWMDRSWWNNYDQIMYVDSDVMALPHATNIFDEYPTIDEHLKSAWYPKFRDTSPSHIKKLQKLNPLADNIPGEVIKKKFIQPGVIILNKICTRLMLPWVSKYANTVQIGDRIIDDGMFLNDCIVKSNIPLLDMHKKWNHKNNGKHFDYSAINFLHCAGGNKHKRNSEVWKVLQKIYPEVIVDLSTLD